MTRKMELVMHLRGAGPGSCTLQALLYYAARPQPVEPGEMPVGDPAPELKMERTVVDTRQVTFELPA